MFSTKKPKQIYLMDRKVTPIRKDGENYIYKVGRYKGEWKIKGYDKEKQSIIFTKVN